MSALDAGAGPWTYDAFFREGLALIPAWAPGWTNHNASDPGITLLELCAFLSDVLAYRALRITPDAKLAFLRLLDGPGDTDAAWRARPVAELDAAIGERVAAMARTRCLVTPQDVEHAALEVAAQRLGPDEIVRARAVPGVDLSARSGRPEAVPGVTSVVLAPERELAPDALAALCREVEQALAPRCLLATRVRVVEPVLLHVFVGARVAVGEGVSTDAAVASIDAALRRRFGPLREGEPVADARPLGRSLFVSELVEAIDGAAGIDWVEDVGLHRVGERGDAAVATLVGLRVGRVATLGSDTRLGGGISRGTRRLLRDAGGELVALRLEPWERAWVRIAPEALTRVGPGGGAGAQGTFR